MNNKKRPHLKLATGIVAANGKPTNTAATGSIPSTAGSTITTGTSFVLDDGINPAVQFIWDSGSAVTETQTKRKLAFTTGDNAATIQTTLIAAINNAAIVGTFKITATDGGSNITTLTNNFAGAHGNVAVANNSISAITGMSGGIDVGLPLNGSVPGTSQHWNLHDAGIILVNSTAGSGTMDVTVRIWCYSYLNFTWHPMGSDDTTVTNRGMLNDKFKIEEDIADKLAHTEPIIYLSGFDRIYAQIVAVNNATVDVWLNSCAKQTAV